jgi:hypothetical protein
MGRPVLYQVTRGRREGGPSGKNTRGFVRAQAKIGSGTTGRHRSSARLLQPISLRLVRPAHTTKRRPGTFPGTPTRLINPPLFVTHNEAILNWGKSFSRSSLSRMIRGDQGYLFDPQTNTTTTGSF